MPPMPPRPRIKEGILKGMYKFLNAENPESPLRAQLFGSGAIMNEVLEARKILAERFDVDADVWSVTSY
jgi:pyruvate dehydrogenase E1 component